MSIELLESNLRGVAFEYVDFQCTRADWIPEGYPLLRTESR
jgi:hypothetical protein